MVKHRESAKKYNKALDELGWSQVDAAKAMHVDARTSRRYALGERKVPWVTQDWLEMKVDQERAAKANIVEGS